MCGKPGKGRHGTSHYAKVMYQKLEAQVSLYRSPDINKPSYECLHAEYI
jgi:hypothetical protein